MIFTDDRVNLPERLLQSLTDNRLVVFVGAGVSMRAYKDQTPNTCYPGYKELAGVIAQRLSRPIIMDTEQRDIDNGNIDRVLGDWEDQRCNIRTHAAAILTENEDRQRLELHRALIRLFTSNPTPRIVTTNFDRLLIRALEAEGLTLGGKWNIGIAPALPSARRFRGICYLHGCADGPEDMVLTDKDIGRAYMDEGWALRFAHSIFQRFDVLFVGYRLEDPPLRYLSLALEGTTGLGRWALIPDQDLDAGKKADDERDWQRRHVEPIWYSATDKDYRALERTIDAWGRDHSRSFLDRRNVLAEMGRTKPNSLKPHELNRAKFFLRGSSSLRDFANAPLDTEWFDNLFSWGHFDFLIKGSGEWSEAHRILAERFIDWMISNPVEVLGKVAENRTTLHIDLFDQFCRRYQEGKAAGVDVESLRRILEFFRPAVERSRSFVVSSTFFKRILGDLLDNGYEDDAFWLLGITLRTRTIITKSINFAFQAAIIQGESTESIPEYELHYEQQFENQITELNVRETVNEVFLPRISSIGFRLVDFLTRTFLEIRSIDSRGKRSELGSHFARPAIETHPQNFSNDPVNILLDFLRDCWEELLKVNRAQAETICLLWGPLKDELIERLRVHALRKLVETQND